MKQKKTTKPTQENATKRRYTMKATKEMRKQEKRKASKTATKRTKKK